MAKLGFANLTSLLFNFLTISNIIYNKQSSYDQLTFRNNWNAHYDYVIIGAGTAGSVLAARLTEDPEITVLLLEAGGSETVTSNTPGLSETLIGTVMDWKSLTVPQNHSCLAMNGQQCHLASGRVIGGTSSINRMYYLRGNPNDFDVWQQKFGLKSWSWKDVFPYMIRNENQKDPERAKSGHYGLNGPVCIEQINKSSTDLQENKILDSFLAACQQVGYRNIDLNTGVQQGSSILQSTIHNGKRQSMSSAFLEPNFKTRQNLHILANSVAMNLLWENDRAIGVKFYRDWQQYSVFARQEVIISAGALFTPKILQLSGVGPRPELNRLGIPVVADLPVGDNLHDHVGTLGLYFVANQLPESSITKQHLKQYFYYGKGPLAESKYGAAVFPAKKAANSESTFQRHYNHLAVPSGSPDLMLLTYLNGLTNRELSAELTEQQINLKRSIWNQYYGEKLKLNNGKLQFTIIPMVLKPKSRGRIRLKSTNPMDMPLIDPNYFGDPDDLEQLAQAMREALRLARTKPFEQYDTQWYRTLVPGCETEFQKFQTEFDTMFNNNQPAQDDSNDAYHGMEPEPIIGHSEMKPILTFIEDYFNNGGGQMVDQQQSTTTSTTSIITTTSTVDNRPIPSDHGKPTSSTSGSGGGSGNGGYSNNLPFHFMSSFVSKLFRRASLKKFQKADHAKRIRSQRQSRQHHNQVNHTNHPFYYDQYWLGSGDPKSMIHPLINKTIYGGLVDGFSSASGSASSQFNTDQSVITVWNNHRDRKHPRPLPAMEAMKTTTSVTSVTPEASLADILPPDVQPIVLTGFFQSPPKPQGQIVAIKKDPISDSNHQHHLHYHHHHRPELQPVNRVTPSSAIVTSAASKLPVVAQSSKSSSGPGNQSRNDHNNHNNNKNGHHHVVDAYLKCMARQLTMPIGDYVGTCRMGVPGDRKRVVDERFRVVGVRALRVIDCSVVPEITTGGLAPVAIMLGERGAEFIREDRKQMKLKT